VSFDCRANPDAYIIFLIDKDDMEVLLSVVAIQLELKLLMKTETDSVLQAYFIHY